MYSLQAKVQVRMCFLTHVYYKHSLLKTMEGLQGLLCLFYVEAMLRPNWFLA